jgi:hypothetical protein
MQRKAIRFIGNKEYPKVQMQWKIERFPPKSYAFIEIITDPIQTKQNTMPKISLAVWPYVPLLRVHDKEIHKTKGPQRSQFFSFLTSPKGIMTILILLKIYLISLTRLRKILSSKVLSFYYLKFCSILKLLPWLTGDSFICIIIYFII